MNPEKGILCGLYNVNIVVEDTFSYGAHLEEQYARNAQGSNIENGFEAVNLKDDNGLINSTLGMRVEGVRLILIIAQHRRP